MAAYNAHWLCLAFSRCVLETDPYPTILSFFVPLHGCTVVCLERPPNVFNQPPIDACAGCFPFFRGASLTHSILPHPAVEVLT